jgi:DNA-directed RNA polymerase specialized sigma24 family protein
VREQAHGGLTKSRKGALIEQLLGQRAAFLRFLAAKVGPAAAEDILQTCYLKLVEKGLQLQKNESIVSWFYTVLRHATVDYYRRNATRDRAHEQFAAEAPVSYETEVKASKRLNLRTVTCCKRSTSAASLSLSTRTRKAQPPTMRAFAFTGRGKLRRSI